MGRNRREGQGRVTDQDMADAGTPPAQGSRLTDRDVDRMFGGDGGDSRMTDQDWEGLVEFVASKMSDGDLAATTEVPGSPVPMPTVETSGNPVEMPTVETGGNPVEMPAFNPVDMYKTSGST